MILSEVFSENDSSIGAITEVSYGSHCAESCDCNYEPCDHGTCNCDWGACDSCDACNCDCDWDNNDD